MINRQRLIIFIAKMKLSVIQQNSEMQMSAATSYFRVILCKNRGVDIIGVVCENPDFKPFRLEKSLSNIEILKLEHKNKKLKRINKDLAQRPN